MDSLILSAFSKVDQLGVRGQSVRASDAGGRSDNSARILHPAIPLVTGDYGSSQGRRFLLRRGHPWSPTHVPGPKIVKLVPSPTNHLLRKASTETLCEPGSTWESRVGFPNLGGSHLLGNDWLGKGVCLKRNRSSKFRPMRTIRRLLRKCTCSRVWVSCKHDRCTGVGARDNETRTDECMNSMIRLWERADQ